MNSNNTEIMKNLIVPLFLFCGVFYIPQANEFYKLKNALVNSDSTNNTEFGKSNNGLLYSDTAIKKLKLLVDSLNLKFKVCDINKNYLSMFQGKANYIYLNNSDKVKNAIKDMQANMPFDDFVKKYSLYTVEKELLVVRSNYKNYDGEDGVEFSSITLSGRNGHEFNFDDNVSDYTKSLKGKWIFKDYSKIDDDNKSLGAFYFIGELKQQIIPEKYAKMIQYSDCLVDTSSKIYFESAYESGKGNSANQNSKVSEFMDYIHEATNKPDNEDEDYNIYRQKHKIWDSLRMMRIDSLKLSDKKFAKLFNDAIKATIDKGGSDNEFEEYVERYYSKNTALELKRNRRVIGGCSMDEAPRVHALNIAKLSAETTNWEIFLRSHLDIMNDRFERVSDGSYAWGRRKTYIKELEVLDINVLELLLGISLRIENPSTNHYYGSIGRLGRALSETIKTGELEDKMLQMISDNQLDDFNRVLVYYLYTNYNSNLDNKENKKENIQKLTSAGKTLPEYLASKITEKK